MNEQTKQEGRSFAVPLTAGLEALRKLAYRSHYYCDDKWYSCPKSEGGCENDTHGDECTCGADEHNEEVNKAFEVAMEASNVK